MDNRFSTMTEVRRVAWPNYETPEWGRTHFLQGIAGTLELFHRSTLSFQQIVAEVTGHPVAVFQRIDQAGYKLPIDERILAGHRYADGVRSRPPGFRTGGGTGGNRGHPRVAEARRDLPDARAASRCRLFGRHEAAADGIPHHGDALVPRQQRFGQYTRSLMKALDVPVMNQYGLRPALVKGTKQIAPLSHQQDLDKIGPAQQRHDLQLPSPPAALCGDRPMTPNQSMCWRASRSISTARIPSPQPAIRSSTACSGCLHGTNAPDISCSPTPRSSRRCSVGRIAWRRSGKTSPGYEGANLPTTRAQPRSPVEAHVEFLSKVIPVTLLVFVVSSMLAVGLSLTVGEILAPLRNRKLVSLALLANFVLMPLAALVLARLLRLDEPLAAALLLLGTAAGAPFLPKLAVVAKGSLAFAVGLMVMLMALTVGYMPLVLPLLLEGVSVDPLKIARSLVLLMLIPLVGGLAVKARYQAVAARVAALLNRVSSLTLVLLIALLLATNIQNIADLFGTRGVLASILFLLAAFGTGWFLGGRGLIRRACWH